MLWVIAIALAPIVAGLHMAGMPLIWAVIITFAAFVVVAQVATASKVRLPQSRRHQGRTITADEVRAAYARREEKANHGNERTR